MKTSLLNNTRKVKYILFLAFFGISVLGWGQLLVEDFNYSVGTVLTATATADPTTGWLSHSGNGTQNIDVTNGLSFTGFGGSGIGGAANLDNNGQDINKTFTSQNSGTVYASFMMQTQATNSAGYFFMFSPSPVSSTFFSRIYINATGSGIGISGGSAPGSYVSITAGTTALIVVKHDFTTHVSSLYVLNSFSSTEPGTASQTFSETATAIGAVAMRQYNAAQRIIVDGIRVGTSWSSVMPSNASLPSVTTTAVSTITTTTASSGGEVTSDGGASVTARGVAFGASANPTSGTSDGSGTGTFTSSLTSLTPNTRYYYRAYATNSAGDGYGTEDDFYTLAATPTAPSVNGTTFNSLNVTIGVSDGNPIVTTYAIHETTTGLFVQADGTLGVTPVWQTSTAWSTITVTGLSSSTTYTFEIKAINGDNIETSYSSPASETTLASATISAQTGNWSDTSTWVGGVVPNSSTNAVIATGHIVTLDTTSGGINTRNSGTTTTVNAGGTLATSVQYINNGTTTIDGSFQLNAGGYTNSGNNFVYGANGTLIFNNTSSYGVNNSDQYWPTTSGPYNVTILQGGMTLNSGANRTVAGIFQTAAGVTLNATLTLSGTCQINGGGYFNNAPTYTGTSTLIYNSVSNYGVNNEWTGNSTSAGVGIPQNVTLTNSSVNLPNSNRGLAGSLNIDSGSTLNQNVTSGDLYIAGNWVNSGTFNANNRAVFFNGSSAQTLTGATTYAWLFFNNSNGLSLNNSVVVNNTLTLTNGKITIGTNDLTINDISGASSSNYVVTNSTGQLKRTVGASNVTFPVGNSAYNPITFNNSGTSDVYGVRVEDGALTTALVNTKTINRKWITTEFVAGGSNLSVVAQYNTGEPNTGYDAGTNPYIGFYNGSVWSQVAATLSGSDPYTATSAANSTPADLTSGTQFFAVGKDNAFESDATHLVFVNVPLTGNVSVNLVAFTVEALRSDDSLDTTFTGSVTITKASGPGNLGGTLSIPAVNGVATFNAAQFDAIGTYTLQVTSGSLTPATSGNIVISEILAAWDFTGVGSTSLPTYAATTFNSGLSTTSGANNITRGADAAWSTASNSFRTQGFKNEGIATSNTDYFQTTLKVKTGYEMSLYSIDARFAGTASYCATPGVSNQFAYSLDGTNFTLIGSPIMIIGTPGTLPQIDISAISALQNLPADTTVTFRYYASGQTTTGGWGFNSPISGTNGLAFSGKMICIQPTAYTVSGGGAICDDASTTIDLSDSEIGMNYQLKKDGNNEGAPLAGTGAALSFTGINQAGTYTVVATNTNGSCSLSTDMTGSAVVTITPDTSITTHPITQEICVGQPVTFTVVAANSSAYSYEWKKNGVTVGTDSDTFTILSTVVGDAGNYTVEVLGDCGAVVTSNVATLSFTPQVITWANLETPSNGTNVIVMGQDFTIQSQVYIECVTDGSGDDSTLKVWIGYNTTDSNPSGWTNWVEVTAPAADLGNNYRYSLSTRDLLPSVSSGTFYIAARYQYDNGAFVYGGYSSGGGGIWDNTNYFNGKLEIQPISLYGNATGSVELDMYSSDGVHFSTTVILTADWAKFKQNHAWTINWGSSAFPSGTGTQDGDNIPVSPAGTYLVTFNRSTGAYNFTNINCTSSITTTWNGTTWDNGTPDMTKKAVFDADYNTTTDPISACECQINASKTVTVADDTYFTISKSIVNNGNLVVESQGNVIQYEATNTNTGTGYKVKKTTSTAMDYDYVYWSSPVSNADIATVFSENPSYRYQFVTGNFVDLYSGTSYPQADGTNGDGYDDNGNDWTSASGSMSAGKGYIVMAKGSEMPINSTNLAAMEINPAQQVEFTGGVFNSGDYSMTALQDGTNDQDDYNYNLNFIGNPYPSAISADRFINTNTAVLEGTLYFWTHKTAVAANAGPNAYDFNNADFATYTLSGGVASANGGTIPTGNIASCQGFMASVKETASGNIVFNNLMRLAENNNNFYRQAVPIEKDRLWLKMTGNDDLYRQILVAFLPEATTGFDQLYDGLRMYDETTEDFYSVLNHQKYAIQAYPAFDVNYEIPLGIQIKQAGTYSIDMDGLEGILEGQNVYLEDTENEVIHNLKSSAYTFTSTVGNFDERFILRFTDSALSNEDTTLSQVKIYPNPSTGVFYINYAGSEKLTYTVYDLTGKKVLMGTGTVMDLSTLNSGIYTAQISNAASVRSVKLIRE
jgi:hypothetical protein